MSDYYLMHHGVKGQKWGVRRYQYKDGSLTPDGRRHYSHRKSNKNSTIKNIVDTRLEKYYSKQRQKDLVDSHIGKKYADSIIFKNTSLYRIQNVDYAENYPFYATFKRDDKNRYAGLLSKQLGKRAVTSISDNTVTEDAKLNGVKIYSLKLKNIKKLSIPSEKELSHTVKTLLKDEEFNRNAAVSIANASKTMHLPKQQMLFKSAAKAMVKDEKRRTDSDYDDIYKAINLSLRNHGPEEIALQNKLYGILKDRNYSAIMDLNDRYYSTFNAKAPVIIFDTDKVKLQSVMQMSDRKINSLYRKYNSQRVVRTIPDQVSGMISSMVGTRITRASDYAVDEMTKYLSKD